MREWWRKIDWLTLKLFLVTAKTRSFAQTAAAESLVSSAVSKRMLELEVAAGIALFARHNRGVSLTPAGEALAIRVRDAMLELDRARVELDEFAGSARGVVRLAANTTAIMRELPQRLCAFQASNPGISVDLHEASSGKVVRAVRDGSADIGLFSAYVPAPGLELRAYDSTRLMLLTPERHPLAQQPHVCFADALDYPFAGLYEDDQLNPLVQLLTNMAARERRSLQFTMRAASIESLRKLVQAGFGITVLPEGSAIPLARALQLRAIALADSWAEVAINLCVRAPTSLPGPARRLMDHLLETAAGASGEAAATPPLKPGGKAAASATGQSKGLAIPPSRPSRAPREPSVSSRREKNR